MKMFKCIVLSLVTAGLLVGCGEEKKEVVSTEISFPTTLMLADKPAQPVSVLDARAKLTKGSTVTVTGDIGGRALPFVGNRAAFVLADETNITACNKQHGDACPKPWDYCCDDKSKISESILLVQVKDTDGRVIKKTLKGLSGLKELSKVVVSGTYDDASTSSNVIINATGIHLIK